MTIAQGWPLPPGVQFREGGANFAIFSRHAERVWLELYELHTDAQPSHRIELTPEMHRTGDMWHVWVEDIRPGQLYAYRIDGPYDPGRGHRYNSNKLLLDPYARAITHLDRWDFERALGYDPASPLLDASFSTIDNAGSAPKCVVTDGPFSWGNDRPLRRSWSETVIYEVHVRGFTVDPQSGVSHPGTFRGLVEKIPYLKELGITAVELLPVQEFNEYELVRVNPYTGDLLRQYWGYNPTALMAPNGSYSSAGSHGQQVDEFREMVKALHAAGIEVILDVVFNHTAEGSELGPTFCWRGIDNGIYYLLESDPRFYRDYTGTGNTIKAAHSVVRDHILDALRYWAVEMHVDGFRFDLASVLGRGEDGRILADPPLLRRIAEEPVLRDVKLIAEAWDMAGAYQVGGFYKRPWAEWNGRFRDDVRRYWRGDDGLRASIASRLCGSEDLYAASGKGPNSSINFVTSHDGFTLNDLVSYEHKHNEPNGEFNRDGTSANYGANYGAEGPTEDRAVAALRERQIKNILLTLLVARGVPMLLAGDEMRRTQQGNNNAYCQDNEISWHDWRLLDANQDIFRFASGLIAFRHQHPALRMDSFCTDDDVQWFGPDGNAPIWTDARESALAWMLSEESHRLFFALNPDLSPIDFLLPPPRTDYAWHAKADTAAASPADLHEEGHEPLVEDQQRYQLKAGSSIILMEAPRHTDSG
jgi:glycogen operon protein